MSKIYFKLARYFIFLIITTCLASMLLFFITVGWPLTKDFHRLIRKQVLYYADLTAGFIDRGASREELNQFLTATSDSYEAVIALFNQDLIMVAGPKSNETQQLFITTEMLSTVQEKGFFVQPNHMGKPLIYVLPISSKEKGVFYFYLYKKYSMVKQAVIFLIGLTLLCLLLILAIYPLAKGFTRPLIQLTEGLKDIAAGKFDADINVGKRKDELGDLLRVFRDMSHSVDRMIESRKALLADISHELRSPLGRLSIAAELIKESSDDPDLNSYIDNIEYEVNYMNNLLKQLSEYSTLNLPNIQLYLEQFSPSHIIDDVFKHYQPIMKKQGITFVIDDSFESNSLIEADRARITSVFNNLLDNAMHACTPEGKITIDLKESDGKITFSIANTGPEIPEHLRKEIFTPLFRTDPSRSRKTGGLGLGLAIAKQIVELHGGKISCNCENGITKFQFTLKTV